MTTICTNLQATRLRIAAAAGRCGRNDSEIFLLAVSKACSADQVRQAAEAGQRRFGENYAQEGVKKIEALADLDLEWHFIGPLQSNKTRLIAQHFDWVHSIDRLNIAERLSAARGGLRSPLQVCVQVNISGEDSKSGVAPSALVALAQAVTALPNLRLRGLMAIPEAGNTTDLQRARYAGLRLLRDELNAQGLALDTLSIGMSDDLEEAILEGATIVRVGRAIFGERIK